MDSEKDSKARTAEEIVRDLTVLLENVCPVGPTNWYSVHTQKLVAEIQSYATEYAEEQVREVSCTCDSTYERGYAEGYKAGQIAMRERAARRASNGFDAEQVRSLSIEEK